MEATTESQTSESGPTSEAQRVRDAIEMHEFGVALYRQRMRREHPEADETKIEAWTRTWLNSPPRPDRLRDALADRAW